MNPLFKLLLLSFFLPILAFAASPIDLNVNHHYIGKQLQVYEDTTAEKTLEDILTLPTDAFVPVNNVVDSRVFTSSAYWYRFTALNPNQDVISRLIVFDIPWLDVINIDVIGPDGSHSHTQGGDNSPYAARTLKSNLSNFEHRFAPGVSTVYVQVITRDPFIIPISVMDRTAFVEHTAGQSVFISFIYGILGAMMLYNLFLYISMKTRVYAYYVLYVGMFIIMNASYKCYTFEWLFPNDPFFQNWVESSFIYLFSVTGFLFTQSFLNLKSKFPKLDRLTDGMILFYLAAMLIFFAIGYHYHVMFSIILVALFSMYAFSVGIYTYMRGNTFALYFLLGTSSGLIGTALTALTVMAIIPYHDVLFHAVDYGMIMDAILLSLAIAEKIKTIQKEKMIALTEANTDTLTGLLNRRSYETISKQEINRVDRYHGNLSMILMDIDYFKQVNDTYGHAGGDAVLKTIAVHLPTLIRSNDYVFRIGGEEFVFLLPQTDISMAMAHAQRIRSFIEELKIPFEHHHIHVTVSMGISEYTPMHSTIESMYQVADNHLYHAKAKGRNQIIANG